MHVRNMSDDFPSCYAFSLMISVYHLQMTLRCISFMQICKLCNADLSTLDVQ